MKNRDYKKMWNFLKHAVNQMRQYALHKVNITEADKAAVKAYDNVIRHIKKAEEDPSFNDQLEVPMYITKENDHESYDKMLDILRWDKTGLDKPEAFKIVAIESMEKETASKEENLKEEE